MPIRVLIVDDSAVIRGLMSKALAADPAIVVAGTAANGEMAIGMARELRPDVVILDIEMPVMDGITALPGIIASAPQCKVLMASTLTLRNAEISMKALELGATDYLPKPSAKTGQEVEAFYRELIRKVKALASAQAFAPAAPAARMASPPPKAPCQPPLLPPMAPPGGIHALAIASSTGGPQALMSVLGQLQGKLRNVPIFITQHMPPTFTTILADHLGKAGGRPCIEAQGGERVEPGHVYLARGDYHMLIERNGTGCLVRTTQDAPENYCRPAADPMLRSLSAVYGARLLVVVLTGMGQDGLEGARIVVQNGGSVIAQDEATSVVWGMPKAVSEAKLCRAVLPLADIGQWLIRAVEGK